MEKVERMLFALNIFYTFRRHKKSPQKIVLKMNNGSLFSNHLHEVVIPKGIVQLQVYQAKRWMYVWYVYASTQTR